MPTLGDARRRAGEAVATLDGLLGRVTRPLAGLVPRRLRRVAEKIERQRSRPIGQIAAGGFLAVTILYGLVAGGQIRSLADNLLVAAGFGVENVRIQGNAETSDIAVLEQLDIGGKSLLSFDAAEARKRVVALPWVARATVRKTYPDTLTIEIEERKPFALWQNDGDIFVIDKVGAKIVPLEENRFAGMPFVVGDGANEKAADFLAEAMSQPAIAERMRSAVYIAGRRWDIHLENGLTVKLPEKAAAPALAQLVQLDSEQKLLSRDVVVIDLRQPDRVTLRLPEGRSLDEINGTDKKAGTKVARAKT